MLRAFFSAMPPIVPRAPLPDRAPSDSWEEIRVLVISSPDGVRETVHELHRRGFAQVGAWSKLLPGPNPGEVMSILTRRRSKERSN